MPKYQIHELSQYATDRALKGAVSHYKNYSTIRRDLRKANEICSYVIELHESIKQGNTKLEHIKDSLFLVRASVMHAIMLYSRWFKATSGKQTLDAKNFFKENSHEMAVHVKVVEHRDRYIAHNELDLLGEDRVWVNIDSNGGFISTESDWVEEQWLQGKELHMDSFRNCIYTVHNKIDAEILPEKQKKLDKKLIQVLGVTA